MGTRVTEGGVWDRQQRAAGSSAPVCSAPVLQMLVVIQPEDNAECAAMYALDQVMDWLDKQAGWDAAKPRIAQWFHAKYGQNHKVDAPSGATEE